MINTFGSGKVDDEKIAKGLRRIFSFKPANMIAYLDLLRPIYKKTAAYGHYGREEPEFTWEKVDKTEELLEAVK